MKKKLTIFPVFQIILYDTKPNCSRFLSTKWGLFAGTKKNLGTWGFFLPGFESQPSGTSGK